MTARLSVPEEQPKVVTLRVNGRMLSHSSSELDLRSVHRLLSDERPPVGEDRGPSPLELVLSGLCA